MVKPAPCIEEPLETPVSSDPVAPPLPVAKTEALGNIQDIINAERAKEQAAKQEQQRKKLPSFCNLVSSAELLAMDLRPEFLVQGRPGQRSALRHRRTQQGDEDQHRR